MQFIEDVFEAIVSGQTQLKKIDSIDDQKLYDFYLSIGAKSQDLLVVLEELLINSQEHGKNPISFYYDKLMNVFTFAVVDSGFGIHSTVPNNVHLKDVRGKSSSSILRLSLEEGISGTGQVGRGMGLYYLSKLATEKKATVLLSSNAGLVIQQSNLIYEKKLASDIKCNCVIIQINAKEIRL